MHGIILAAGRGSRMGAATELQPKCLTLVGGSALLEFQRKALTPSVGDKLTVITGYRSELLSNFGLDLIHNPKWNSTNMVGSLMVADQILKSEESIVSYSDILYPGSAVSSLRQNDSEIAVLYSAKWLDIWRMRFTDPLDDAESFKLGLDGAITEIGLPVEDIAEVQGQYMGLIKFQPTGWEKAKMIIEETEPEIALRMSMTELLQMIIVKFPQTVFGVPFFGNWWEFDSENDIKAFEKSKLIIDLH